MNAAPQRSIVIAYEDDYCGNLHLLIKALRRDRGLPGLCLEARSVHGTGGFARRCPGSCARRSKRPGGRRIASCASPTPTAPGT